MIDQNWLHFLHKAKENYYKIGAVSFPAFHGELVYFNKYGWNHLTRKNGKLRNIDDQKRRMLLISCAVDILKTSTSCQEYRSNSSSTEFWSFSDKIGSKVVTVYSTS